jgi:hypothetical protein
VQNILDEGRPIVAVLMNRGGWISAFQVMLGVAFPADDTPALWFIDTANEGGDVLHRVYVEAQSIVGISCNRGRVQEDLS